MTTVPFRLIGFACWLLSPKPRQPFWAHDLTKIGRVFYAAAVKALQEQAARAKTDRPHKRKRVA